MHRWYELNTSRYSSSDPVGLRVGLNLFGYALGRPLVAVDPLGLQTTPPLQGRRDPFRPPADLSPGFEAGPWGRRPNRGCCKPEEVDRRRQRIPEITRQLEEDGTAETLGPGAMTVLGNYTMPGGWLAPFPMNPFNPGCTVFKDPCVRYCCRVHEWHHFRDRRWWHPDWSYVQYTVHKEIPAYELEDSCLATFQ